MYLKPSLLVQRAQRRDTAIAITVALLLSPLVVLGWLALITLLMGGAS